MVFAQMVQVEEGVRVVDIVAVEFMDQREVMGRMGNMLEEGVALGAVGANVQMVFAQMAQQEEEERMVVRAVGMEVMELVVTEPLEVMEVRELVVMEQVQVMEVMELAVMEPLQEVERRLGMEVMGRAVMEELEEVTVEMARAVMEEPEEVMVEMARVVMEDWEEVKEVLELMARMVPRLKKLGQLKI